MKIIAMEVGYIATNCYIVVNEETHHGVIIDPGGDAGRIMEAVQKENLTVDAIFLTHGHGDHIMALAEVAENRAPVYISKEDAPMLTDPVGSLAAYIGGGALKKAADKFYADGDEVEAAGIKFKVLATPGHTPGGVCLLTGGVYSAAIPFLPNQSAERIFPAVHTNSFCSPLKKKFFRLTTTLNFYRATGLLLR